MAAPVVAPRAVVKKTKALNPKHYILSALMAILIAAVVVTAVFVVLSPARIYFSVTDARSHHSSGGGGPRTTQLTLTLAANNSSPRTRVEYHSLFVDLTNDTGPQLETSPRTAMTTAVPLLQPARNVTAIVASVPLLQGVWDDDIQGNAPSKPFAVIVTASVRFRVGFAKTRMYDIKVTCAPVSFVPSDPNRKKGVKQSAAPAPLPPAPCV